MAFPPTVCEVPNSTLRTVGHISFLIQGSTPALAATPQSPEAGVGVIGHHRAVCFVVVDADLGGLGFYLPYLALIEENPCRGSPRIGNLWEIPMSH